MVKAGEMGYPSVLTAKTWGFYDVLFRGRPFSFQRPYGSYVMENVLFKISYPAEFHAQTAVEAAMALRKNMLAAEKSADDIAAIQLRTHEACLRIIDKKGPLNNPADRTTACSTWWPSPSLRPPNRRRLRGLLCRGPAHRRAAGEDAMHEERTFTADYHDPEKRSIANSLTLTFRDGTTLTETVEYPLGHRRRRSEGIPLLEEKFRTNLARRFAPPKQQAILEASLNQQTLERLPVQDYVDLYAL